MTHRQRQTHTEKGGGQEVCWWCRCLLLLLLVLPAAGAGSAEGVLNTRQPCCCCCCPDTDRGTLTPLQVLLVLGAPFVVELCCFGVIHPHLAQLTPVHGVALPVLQAAAAAWHRAEGRGGRERREAAAVCAGVPAALVCFRVVGLASGLTSVILAV